MAFAIITHQRSLTGRGVNGFVGCKFEVLTWQPICRAKHNRAELSRVTFLLFHLYNTPPPTFFITHLLSKSAFGESRLGPVGKKVSLDAGGP